MPHPSSVGPGCRKASVLRRLVHPVATLLTLTVTVAQEPSYRTWKDVHGRQIEASFSSGDDSTVILKLKSGAEITVPLASLSEADQTWITEHAKKSTGAEGHYDGPPAETDWPRTVSLKELPNVRVVREDRESREFVYETDRYEFVCDSQLGANTVREFSRVFEATWMANCLLPLDFKPIPEPEREKFRARIFTNKQDYLDTGGVPGSAGVYSSRAKALMLPLDSLGVKMFGSRVAIDYTSENYKTLIHEITHQMMNRWLGRLPVWYVEGAAEYVELAKFDNGRFSFVQQDDRLTHHLYRMSGGRFPMLPLERLMTVDGRTWATALVDGDSWRNYASALVLTYYFYHLDGDGKATHFKEYLRAVEKLQDDENAAAEAVKTHLLRDRDYAALQADVQKAMRRLGITVEFTE